MVACKYLQFSQEDLVTTNEGKYSEKVFKDDLYIPVPEVVAFPAVKSNYGGVHNGSINTLRVGKPGFGFSLHPSKYPPLIPSGNKPTTTTTEALLKPNGKIYPWAWPTSVNWFGIFLAFISGVFFTLCSALVKYLNGIDPMQLLLFRSLFQVIITLPIALCKKINLLGPEGLRGILFIQGIMGGVKMVLLFYAFRLLPIGDAATIIFSSPVMVMIMSHIWLREPCGFYRTFVLFLLVTGVIFVTKPAFIFSKLGGSSSDDLAWGYLAAIAATVFNSFNLVIMRKCNSHYSIVVCRFSLWSFVFSSIIIYFFTTSADLPKIQDVEQCVLVLLVGIFGLLGQILVAAALNYEGAGRVAVTRSADIVFAYILQVVIFGEVPDSISLAGAGMVMACILGMGTEDMVHKFMQYVE